MRTFWVYTGARFLILVAAGGLLWLAGARGVLLIVLAFLVSMLVSYWALAGMRERLAAGVQARAERINERIEAANRAEDGGADPEAVDDDGTVDASHDQGPEQGRESA